MLPYLLLEYYTVICFENHVRLRTCKLMTTESVKCMSIENLYDKH